MTKQEIERKEVQERLREILRPGDTVYTVLRHKARSGMMRAIDLYKVDNNGDPYWLSSLVARATGLTFSKRYEALVAGGCGMDMGFHLVYELSAMLYPQGFECIGERCPANDHANGDRDYTPHAHPHAGGYALRHRWL
mgnify:CR=1 FL=1